MGPLLFIIYNNDLDRGVTSQTYIADDTKTDTHSIEQRGCDIVGENKWVVQEMDDAVKH